MHTVTAWSLTLLCSLVGAGYVIAGKLLATDSNPISLTLLRILIATLCFLPFVSVSTYRKLPGKDLAILCIAGICGIFFTNVLYFKSLEYISPITAALINSLVPLCILGINSLYFNKMPSCTKISSYLLGLLGVLIITTQGLIFCAVHTNWYGTTLMMLSVLGWIIYSICAQMRSEKLSSEAFTLGTFIVGLVPLLPLGMYYGVGSLVQELSWVEWLLIGYISIFATGFGYYLYAHIIHYMGADKASYSTYSTVPLFVILLMYLFFNTPITAWDFIGSLCIIGSLALQSTTD